MNYLFLATGLFFIVIGLTTKRGGKKTLKVMGDLCSAAIANTGGTMHWLRKNLTLCGSVVTAVSLAGITLEKDVSFYALLALFVFAVHLGVEFNYHDDDK